tara:strand:+ start:293 stop:880 length:588 start_codon:yes stop_codon:yes gene_type:complete
MTTPHHTIRVMEGDCFIPPELAAIILGISKSSLSEWVKGDDPPPYDPIARGYSAKELGNWVRTKQILRKGRGGSLQWLPPNVVIRQDTGGLPSAVPTKRDFNFEKTRKEAAAADKIEMENAISRGELVLAADVEKGWSDILSRVKTRMMQIPYTCAMMVSGMTDMAAIQEVIREAVRDALMEMSADWRKPDGEGE